MNVVSHLTNSHLVIISFDDQLGMIVVVHIFKELIRFLIVAIGFEKDAVPEEFITYVELDSELDDFTYIMTLVYQNLDRLL